VLADISYWEVVSKMQAEFGETQARGVLTCTAVTAVVIVVSDVFEFGSFEAGVFHGQQLQPVQCDLSQGSDNGFEGVPPKNPGGESESRL
jgi:hypothetical protein